MSSPKQSLNLRYNPHWAHASSAPLARPRHPLATPTPKAGHLPPPSSALNISEEGTLNGTVNPSPWILLAFSSALASAPVSFLPIFEKPLKRGISAHWCSFLTSHSVLNTEQSDLTSCSPFLVTISVVSRKTLMKSSIPFRNLFFWYVSVSVFAKMLPDINSWFYHHTSPWAQPHLALVWTMPAWESTSLLIYLKTSHTAKVFFLNTS